ncbi:MAG: RNase adapter RapZ [Thermodesulfovibrionales bacterium]|nr:RNase adapter RapZ [Thermodesulfovibrionales bacterium]
MDNKNSFKVLILSGISGAGKSVALKALEDIGYHCIDNLPSVLITSLIDTLKKRRHQKDLAVCLDIRDDESLMYLPDIVFELKRNMPVEVVFLEADDSVMLKRYKETRRPHPMIGSKEGKDILSAIRLERSMLKDIKEISDRIIDTSQYNPHELRRLVQSYYGDKEHNKNLYILLISFGFKHGLPNNLDLLFDLRFLPNPYFVEDLKPLKGTDKPVYDYVVESQTGQQFVMLVMNLLEFMIDAFINEGRSYLNIGFGCTGGRHRSPAITLHIAELIRKKFNLDVDILYRDIDE